MRIHGLRVSFDARTFAWTVLIYAGMGAIFTGVSLATSAPADQIGTFRQLPAIPGHVAELALAALAIGLAAVVAGGALDASLALLIPTLTVLTDIDHLPSFLGYPQPIRPDHSLLFLAATVAVASVAIRSPSADAAIVSAFCAQIGRAHV